MFPFPHKLDSTPWRKRTYYTYDSNDNKNRILWCDLSPNEHLRIIPTKARFTYKNIKSIIKSTQPFDKFEMTRVKSATLYTLNQITSTYIDIHFTSPVEQVSIHTHSSPNICSYILNTPN